MGAPSSLQGEKLQRALTRAPSSASPCPPPPGNTSTCGRERAGRPAHPGAPRVEARAVAKGRRAGLDFLADARGAVRHAAFCGQVRPPEEQGHRGAWLGLRAALRPGPDPLHLAAARSVAGAPQRALLCALLLGCCKRLRTSSVACLASCRERGEALTSPRRSLRSSWRWCCPGPGTPSPCAQGRGDEHPHSACWWDAAEPSTEPRHCAVLRESHAGGGKRTHRMPSPSQSTFEGVVPGATHHPSILMQRLKTDGHADTGAACARRSETAHAPSMVARAHRRATAGRSSRA